MYLSKNWLSRYVTIPADFDLFTTLSLHTAEVEEAKTVGSFPHMVVGHVVKLSAHPNADKLRVAEVDTGNGIRTIVCGAANIAEGQKVPVALPGAVMPAGFTITEAELRGVMSSGMICSKDELGLTDGRQPGIWELPQDTKTGMPLEEFLGGSDLVLEIENKSITNRPDLFGHYGIAREIAVLTKQDLAPYLQKEARLETDHLPALDITIENPDACSRYVAIVLENIAPKASPAWLVQSLARAGIKSHNSIVDVTNYVMMDLGQPMHAFDYDRIDGNSISVGYMEHEEMPMTTLDDIERHVPKQVLLIKNKEKPLALAGIMGLAHSAISDKTTSILLESATFNKSVIRKGEGLVNLRTDASIRFEKNLAPEHALLGMYKALELLMEIHPEATLASRLMDVQSQDQREVIIHTSWEFLLRRVGDANLTKAIAADLLDRLGFVCTEEGETLHVTVPFWRATGDCSIPEDLVEELCRIYGYNKLVSTVPNMPLRSAPELKLRRFARDLKEALSGRHHLMEVNNYAFYAEQAHADFLLKEGIHSDPIRVLNPLSAEAGIMRTSTIPLLGRGVAKFGREYATLGVFEIEKIYWKENGRVYDDAAMHDFEDLYAGLFLLGSKEAAGTYKEQWEQHAFYHAKAIVEDVIHAGTLEGLTLEIPSTDDCARYPWAHPKEALAIRLKKKTIGLVGGLHPAILAKLDLAGRTAAAAEWSVSGLMEAEKEQVLEPISDFPVVTRDISFVIEKTAHVDAVITLCREFDPLITQVSMRDIFEGENLPNQKSVTLMLELAHPERTLTDNEISPVMDALIEKAATIGATVRLA
ncbi:phenylalanine--tRNA ligase subunit beta [Candidatus Gracilibacteria bacterium CG17_big_fil_post_rev_8_21_14_2_50_48_13]|nr:MAG: phenylalanine--tRNA ligase subunit beta [Candidatus Gracilibacteria bacterium CG17_big_fil_post_rev_8_21_14_2_50_48_13]